MRNFFIFAPCATEDEARRSPPKSGPERVGPVGALIHGSTVDLVREQGAVGKIRRPGRDLNLCQVWAPRWPYHPMWVPFSKTTEEKDV